MIGLKSTEEIPPQTFNYLESRPMSQVIVTALSLVLAPRETSGRGRVQSSSFDNFIYFVQKSQLHFCLCQNTTQFQSP